LRNKKPSLINDLRGKKVVGVRRRGKMLLIDLERNLSLLIHLKMTGQLLFYPREEERNHKKLLQDITEEKVESLEVKEVDDLEISDYLVEEPPSPDMNFQDLLILAAKKEQKAVDLYSDLERKVSKKELKKLFEFLTQQEKSHKLKLEEEYEKHVLEGY